MGLEKISDGMGNVEHILHIRALNVTAVRTRVEFHLGVKTAAFPERAGMWAIRFTTKGVVDLDFLRPDVLEPE